MMLKSAFSEIALPRRTLLHYRNSRFITQWKPFLLGQSEMRNLCKRVDYLNVNEKHIQGLLKFVIEEDPIGLVSKNFALALQDHPDVFHVDFDKQQVELSPSVYNLNLEDRSDVINRVNFVLLHEGMIPWWAEEMIPVSHHFNSPPLLLLEKGAINLYGIKSYGIHVIGYVRDPPASRQITHLWLQHRDKKDNNPAESSGRWLDGLASCKQSYGVGLQQSVIQECAHEASLSIDLVKTAKPVGIVAYNGLDNFGNLKRDTLFCYDMEVPKEFVPKPSHADDKESFELRDISTVIQQLISLDEKNESTIFKPSFSLALIDFYIR